MTAQAPDAGLWDGDTDATDGFVRIEVLTGGRGSIWFSVGLGVFLTVSVATIATISIIEGLGAAASLSPQARTVSAFVLGAALVCVVVWFWAYLIRDMFERQWLVVTNETFERHRTVFGKTRKEVFKRHRLGAISFWAPTAFRRNSPEPQFVFTYDGITVHMTLPVHRTQGAQLETWLKDVAGLETVAFKDRS